MHLHVLNAGLDRLFETIDEGYILLIILGIGLLFLGLFKTLQVDKVLTKHWWQRLAVVIVGTVLIVVGVKLGISEAEVPQRFEPSFGLQIRSIKWINTYNEDGMFIGEIQYTVQNTKDHPASILPPDGAAWYGHNVSAPEPEFKILSPGSSPSMQKSTVITDTGRTAGGRPITTYQWWPEIHPGIPAHEVVTYSVTIGTPGYASRVFHSADTVGIGTHYDCDTIYCEVRIPPNYSLEYGDVFRVRQDDWSSDFEPTGPPKFLAEPYILSWYVVHPEPGLNYLMEVRARRDE